MKTIKFLSIFFILCSFGRSFALDPIVEDEIVEIIYEYADAWNNNSGRGFADNFAQDSDFINIFGMHFHGKDAIQNRHNMIHDTFLQNSSFAISNIEIREVNANLVMAFVRWEVEGFQRPGADECEETIRGIFSHVFINDNGSWEITSTQNTLSR